MDSIKIEDLPLVSKDQLQPDDLLLVSHGTGIRSDGGQQVHTARKLQLEDFSYVVRGNIKTFAPDNVTLSTNVDGQLFVSKVRKSNVVGLGDLASMDESSLNLKDMAHMSIWTGTQISYDAISVKDNNTLYFITDII